jgi:ABC-type proline/glycine betaine transport systems, ATPase components
VNALVQLRGIEKRFGPETALSTIDLEIERGEITVLIGPSGCGKSTILRLIVGLIQPDAGEIYFDGTLLSADSVREIRHRLGYVIQDGGLFPHLTAGGNLSLQPHLLGKRDDEIALRIRELCTLTQFPEKALDRYPVELSGGQRQRVSLMRALMLSPELLLLDEPFAALDPLVRASLQGDLKRICRQLKQTVLLVTHDLAEAARLGSRIVLMQAGHIVQSGSFDDLQHYPATPFVSEFFNAQRSALLT